MKSPHPIFRTLFMTRRSSLEKFDFKEPKYVFVVCILSNKYMLLQNLFVILISDTSLFSTSIVRFIFCSTNISLFYGNKVKPEVLSWSPRIVLFRNFLSMEVWVAILFRTFLMRCCVIISFQGTTNLFVAF